MSRQPQFVTDFDFDLPHELIAQQPPEDRAGARMLTVNRATGLLADRRFTDLPLLLEPGDLLVLNNSRVLPARLFARKQAAGASVPAAQDLDLATLDQQAPDARQRESTPSQGAPGRIEVLLTSETEPNSWSALVRPGKKVHVGDRLLFPHAGTPLLEAEITAHGEFGERTLRFTPVEDFYGTLEALGQMPLPPYIRRERSLTTAEDRERYQTVYAAERGSVAAPTAGLHFTPEVLAQLQARGVELAYITLHVGLGTFQPVRVERLADIHLHRERYTLSEETAEAVNRARAAGRRIVATGTTTVRTLEHCAREAVGQPLQPHSGSTDIFISPGDPFRLVQGLLTNFHLPQSTLLMLVSAFAGFEHTMHAYRHAVASRYRFFSYGDCMLLT